MLTVNCRRESLNLSYGACRPPGALVAAPPAVRILGTLPHCCFSRARQRAENLETEVPAATARVISPPPVAPAHPRR